jgi:hypothetical protein
MRFAERLSKRRGVPLGYHTAIVTSFAVEFSGFDEVMLPQLAAAGATNVLLVADARMTSAAFSDGSLLPRQLGRDYVVLEPRQAAGVFHPKIVLQLGRDGGRAFIGSANATAAGIGGNLEIVTEVACGTETSPDREFVRSVWRYVQSVTDAAGGAAADALRWAADRSPWLAGPQPEEVQTLADGSLIALLARPGASGILERFAAPVDGPVERVVVMSPYFDDDAAALTNLASELGAGNTVVLLDPLSHGLPDPVPAIPGLELVDAATVGPRRLKHAKLILAQTAGWDHVLAGSANCTTTALGWTGFAGVNAEASIYRRVPRGAAEAAMGLTELLGGARVAPSELPPSTRASEPAISAPDDLAVGTFEAEHGELRWTPAARRWGGRLVLLGADGESVGEVAVDDMRPCPTGLCLRVDGLELTHFVQAEDATGRSAVAPLIHRGMLRSRRREAGGRSVASAAARFVDQPDLQLFLLQALDELQRADLEGATPAARAPRAVGAKEDEPADVRILPYDQFVRELPADRRASGGDSTLSGTHGSGVRELLNRLSGAVPAGDGRPEGDDRWMDLGDEDVQRVMTRDVAEAEADETPAADRTAFVKAVRTVERGMAGGTDARAVTGAEVLRLRFWLQLLLHAARRPDYRGGLPCSLDEFGWPRLTLRVLSAFFYPKDAPIARLVVDGGYLDMPVDFLETWATCLRCIDLVAAVLPASRANRDMLRMLPLLRQRMAQPARQRPGPSRHAAHLRRAPLPVRYRVPEPAVDARRGVKERMTTARSNFHIASVERGLEPLWREYWESGEKTAAGLAAHAAGKLRGVEYPEAANLRAAIAEVGRRHPDCTVMREGAGRMGGG